MGPIEATIYCMLHPFRWDARGTRSEFWWFQLMAMILFAVATAALIFPYMGPLYHLGFVSPEAAQGRAFFDEALADRQIAEVGAAMSQPLLYLVPASIWFTFANLAASIRRLHDTDHSGWWYLITLVPFIGYLWYLVLMILPSSSNNNQWGPGPQQDPLQRAKQEAALEPYMQPRTEIDVHTTSEAIRSLRHSRMPSV